MIQMFRFRKTSSIFDVQCLPSMRHLPKRGGNQFESFQIFLGKAHFLKLLQGDIKEHFKRCSPFVEFESYTFPLDWSPFGQHRRAHLKNLNSI